MTIIGAIVGSMGLAAVMYALIILAQFGRKLGAVTKMRPFYKGYYIAIGCVALAIVIRLVRVSVFWAPADMTPPLLNNDIFYFFLYHLPLAIGMSLSLGITWHYWKWLLKER